MSKAAKVASKKNPQNTKKYVVAASALAIAGIVSGVAVAVYLEMLAVGIAVAACCLIAATVTYCCRPKSLIENGEPAEIVFKERSVY
ncbi:TomO hydrophobic C-terminal domain-containing protein [Wolbachia endosymbiont (group B) of Sphaerophoria taeniata]